MKRLIILCMAVVTAFPLWAATGLSDMKWNVLLGYGRLHSLARQLGNYHRSVF